jgi:hypothetical protein
MNDSQIWEKRRRILPVQKPLLMSDVRWVPAMTMTVLSPGRGPQGTLRPFRTSSDACACESVISDPDIMLMYHVSYLVKVVNACWLVWVI